MANQEKIICITVFLVIAFLTFKFDCQGIGTATANPINPPLIQVDSPQNNKIYSSGDILLNFSVVRNDWINFTSASYSLDRRPTTEINGSITLTGLSSGSHTLTVYGKGTYSYGGQAYDYSSVETVIHFSVHYSTAWLNFCILLVAALLTISVVIALKRKGITKALRGRKTNRFWDGLFIFLLFTCVFFIPGIWFAVANYLFPHYSPGIITVAVNPWLAMIFVLVFMGIGLLLMRSGAKGDA